MKKRSWNIVITLVCLVVIINTLLFFQDDLKRSLGEWRRNKSYEAVKSFVESESEGTTKQWEEFERFHAKGCGKMYVLRLIDKMLPKDWEIRSYKIGLVTPAHKLSGQGVVINMYPKKEARSRYTGKHGMTIIWIMDKGYEEHAKDASSVVESKEDSGPPFIYRDDMPAQYVASNKIANLSGYKVYANKGAFTDWDGLLWAIAKGLCLKPSSSLKSHDQIKDEGLIDQDIPW